MNFTDADRLGGISTLDSAESRRALDRMFPVDHAAIAVSEAADASTRAVNAEIKKLMAASGGLDVLEAHAILCTLVSAFATGRVLSNSERGVGAVDYLLSAIHVLEA